MVFLLAFLGLQFTGDQWLIILIYLTPFACPSYIAVDVLLIVRHYRPLGDVLARIDKGTSRRSRMSPAPSCGRSTCRSTQSCA